MDILLKWLSENWFQGLQSLGIICGFLLTAYTFHRSTNARKISNYLLLTQYHRDVWGLTINNPELNRISKSDVDLSLKPLTSKEKRFIHFVFLHMTTAFELAKTNEMIEIQAFKRDIDEFIKKPIPKKHWEEMKSFYNDDFIEFVEHDTNKSPYII